VSHFAGLIHTVARLFLILFSPY